MYPAGSIGSAPQILTSQRHSKYSFTVSESSVGVFDIVFDQAYPACQNYLVNFTPMYSEGCETVINYVSSGSDSSKIRLRIAGTDGVLKGASFMFSVL